jgi:hypothetical protein
VIKLEWKFNGRTVAPGQLGAEVAKAFKAEAIDSAKAAVAEIQCPVHGTRPKNVTVQAEGSRLHFKYEACCDQLTKTVNDSVK